jgi:hypothetical protein
MSGCRFFLQKTRYWLLILLGMGGLNAQNCLVLSPPVISPDGIATMHLSLQSSSGEPPAAVQWTLQDPASSVSSITVDQGPMLTSAGKAAICAGDPSAYKCLAAGRNTKSIPNGVIATVTAVLAPGATTAAIQIIDPLGASAAGYPISISSRIMAVAGTYVSPDCKLHAPPRVTAGGR